MKKFIFTAFCLLAVYFMGNAQQINAQKVFGGYIYSQDGRVLKMNDLVHTMHSSPQALEFMKKAKAQNTLATIIGAIGGGLVGWPVGTALGGGDPEWLLAGIGAGLIAVSIPITISAGKNSIKAIEIYNASLNTTSYNSFKPDLKLHHNINGLGISVKF